MAKEAAELHTACSLCQEPLYTRESLFIQEVGDWRQPYMDFLQQRLLLANHSDEMKIKRKFLSLFVEEGLKRF